MSERKPIGYRIGYALGVFLTAALVVVILAGIAWLLGVRW